MLRNFPSKSELSCGILGPFFQHLEQKLSLNWLRWLKHVSHLSVEGIPREVMVGKWVEVAGRWHVKFMEVLTSGMAGVGSDYRIGWSTIKLGLETVGDAVWCHKQWHFCVWNITCSKFLFNILPYSYSPFIFRFVSPFRIGTSVR